MNIFALILGTGASLGIWQVARRAPPAESSRAIDAGLILLGSCLLGARAGYVLIRLQTYARHWIEIPQFWLGGLSLAGAVVAGMVAILILAAVRGVSLRSLVDLIAPLFPPLGIAGWLGCMQAGCAYGAALDGNPWWGIPVLDEGGILSPRFPLQPLAAFSLLVYFLWLERKPVRNGYPGRLGGLTFLGLGVNLAIFSAIRVDPALLWSGLRVDTWVCLGLICFSLLFSLYAYLDYRRNHHN